MPEEEVTGRRRRDASGRCPAARGARQPEDRSAPRACSPPLLSQLLERLALPERAAQVEADDGPATVDRGRTQDRISFIKGYHECWPDV